MNWYVFLHFKLNNIVHVLEFNKWKKAVEEKENCQYVRRTSMKPGNKVQYMYYDCHRSYSPRLNGTVNIFIFL